VNKRRLAVLLISGILFVAFVPLRIAVFNPSADAGSSGHVPIMSIPADVDKNHNKVEDVFEEKVQSEIAGGNGTRLANVVVLLNVTPSSVQTSVFMEYNGTLARGPWQQALYGFGGKIPYARIGEFASRCPGLLLVQEDNEYETLMAYAAQQAGARTYVWDVLGYKGDPLSSIAVSELYRRHGVCVPKDYLLHFQWHIEYAEYKTHISTHLRVDI
jgi:hypothetical protein